MGIAMFRLSLLLLALVAATSGCCLCAHPYDYCYPTCDGACGGACCEHDGRVLSAFSPRHDPYYAGDFEGEVIEGEYAPAPMSEQELDSAPQSDQSTPIRPGPDPSAARWQRMER